MNLNHLQRVMENQGFDAEYIDEVIDGIAEDLIQEAKDAKCENLHQ